MHAFESVLLYRHAGAVSGAEPRADGAADDNAERGTNRWTDCGTYWLPDERTNGSADRGTDERAERLAHDGRPHRPGGHAGANERADVRADTCSDALVPRCG